MLAGTFGSVTVTGTNFDLLSNLSVSFGAPPQTPTNVTPTSFEVAVLPQPNGMKMVTITSSNGLTVLIGPFVFEAAA